MNHSRKRLIALTGVLAMILALALALPHRGEAQFASPVRVTNVANQPVPTQAVGTTDVTGSTVTVGGTPTVNVTNGANSPVIIRDNDNAARMPFSKSMNLANVCSNQALVFPQDHPNQTLVIELVNYFGSTTAGALPRLTLAVGNSAVYAVIPTRFTINSTDSFQVNQAMRVYVPPNAFVQFNGCFYDGTNFSGSAQATLTISGYLVNP